MTDETENNLNLCDNCGFAPDDCDCVRCEHCEDHFDRQDVRGDKEMGYLCKNCEAGPSYEGIAEDEALGFHNT